MKNVYRSLCSTSLFMLFAMLFSSNVYAQFTPLGVATTLNGCGPNETGYRLITDNNAPANERAAVWSDQTIDLDQGFTLGFTATFSSSDPGDIADGLCFVLQDNGNTALGNFGGNLGYNSGVFAQSLAVEIDLFDNGNAGGIGDGGLGDNDHMSIVQNGSLINFLAGPQLFGTANLADGVTRAGTITWDPCNNVFTATFDGLTLRVNQDIRTLFPGTFNAVTWGFTAGSASRDANHDVCIGQFVPIPTADECTELTDLTACAEEEDFGYIALECGGQNTQYNWDFPLGSTAQEISGNGRSIILNASEGDYTVTVTDGAGCVNVLSYTIDKDCCEDEPPACELAAPAQLVCFLVGADKYNLAWSPVSGAVSYEIEIIPNSAECFCEGREQDPIRIRTNTAPYPISINEIAPCFSWRVRALCNKGDGGPFSATRCLGGPEGDCLVGPFEELLPDATPGGDRQKTDVQVFPNPADEQLTIVTPGGVDQAGQVRLINNMGQLVQVLPVNNDRLTFSTSDLPAGIYFIEVQRQGQAVYQQKIIVNHSY